MTWSSGTIDGMFLNTFYLAQIVGSIGTIQKILKRASIIDQLYIILEKVLPWLFGA